ncbi:MAG TPA: hypothetical protein VGJ93_14310 [Desulfuromonadaceae bacterium]|jgi:hypothetical protein
MVYAFEEIRKLNKILNKLKDDNSISDYRIALKLNMTANIYIVANQFNEANCFNSIKLRYDATIISKSNFDSDDYYKDLFEELEPLDLGLRRNLANVLEESGSIELESCPIVSFYSYKGGVGRTTALALFAASYAMHDSKKVIIIDCDFEAPGMINFFQISNEDKPKNGVVEYLKDKEAHLNPCLRDDYIYEVSKNFSGDGEIYIMPSGNILSQSDRNDYLEALARIDLHDNNTLTLQFKDLIEDLNREFSPDVILIDSRTGFNDIFGIVSTKLSSIAVGFFGNNAQNTPGIQFFLDAMLGNNIKTSVMLALSIVSSSYSKSLASFKDKVYNYINNELSDDLSGIPAIPIFCLSRQPSLEKIGTDDEDPDDIVDFIEKKKSSDYQELFEKLADIINTKSEASAHHIKGKVEDGANNEITQVRRCELQLQLQPINEKLRDLKTHILKKTHDHFPEQYAENIAFTDEFLNTKFYIRRCMDDVFNNDKFLLLGGKGTGKTAFYRALTDKSFFDNLLKRAQKRHLKYNVINAISLQTENADSTKFIDIAANFPQNEIKDTEFFYRRFWVVLIWNAIRQESNSELQFEFPEGLEIKPIRNDSISANYISDCINDNEIFCMIENDLYEIDNQLKKQDQYLMIIFDQLDKVVKPNLWANAISPLIRYAQTHSFTRISPKLFVRRDLYNKLSNLTNKESLQNRVINLEWTKDELFAFLFKVVFSNSKDEFFEYATLSNLLNDSKLKEIKQKIEKPNSYSQLSPDEYILKPLVETFFGKYADSEGKYGEMYDWLYSNLRNADGTISLRPFLDLIIYAIEKQYERPELNSSNIPILSYKCFNADVREKAVARHFNDLAQEEGNDSLRIIINDIRDDRVPREYKFISLLQSDFEKLIHHIMSRHPEIKNESLMELEKTLVLNGILFVSYIPGGGKKYSFAYLYKYYLGLRSIKSNIRNLTRESSKAYKSG